MHTELQALENNNTWNVVPRIAGMHIIGSGCIKVS